MISGIIQSLIDIDMIALKEFQIIDRTVGQQLAISSLPKTVKRLNNKDGFVELRPENSKYKKITFSGDSELVIWGVVT